MLLQFCTWPEVEKYLLRSTGIIVPIGSTEQHGPSGLIGTDALCAEGVGRRLGDVVDGLVAPTIAVGMAQFHLGFPGSMTLLPSTLMAFIKDCIGSLARHGFTHFYLVNGHGGNVATISSAFQEIYASSSFGQEGNKPALRCRCKSWWDNPTVSRIREDLYGEAEGFHATPSEIAMTQYLFPAAIGMAQLVPPPKLKDRFAVDHNADEYYEADDFRRRFPDGRVGSNPSLARPEDGRIILEAAVSDMAVDYRAFLSET